MFRGGRGKVSKDIIEQRWLDGHHNEEIWVTGSKGTKMEHLKLPCGNEYIVCAEEQGDLRVLEERSRDLRFQKKILQGPFSCLQHLGHKRLLIAGANDSKIQIWTEKPNEKTWFLETGLDAFDGGVVDVAFFVRGLGRARVGTSKSGQRARSSVIIGRESEGIVNYVVAVSTHGEAAVFQLSTTAEATSATKDSQNDTAENKAQQEKAAAEEKGDINVVVSMSAVCKFRHPSPIQKVAAEDGVIAVALQSGAVVVHDVDGNQICSLTPSLSTTANAGDEGKKTANKAASFRTCTSLTMNAGIIAMATDTGHVFVWKMQEDNSSASQLPSPPCTGKPVTAIENVDDILIVGDRSKHLRWWRASTGHLLSDYTLESHVTAIATRRGGGKLGSLIVITGSSNGMVAVWDVYNGQTCLTKMEGHRGKVNAVFANRTLAISAAEDQTLRVWRFAHDWDVEEENKRVQKVAQEAEELKLKGNSLYKARKYTDSIVFYERAISLEDRENMPVYYMNRAAAYFQMGEYERCIADCDKALLYAIEDGAPEARVRKALQRKVNAMIRQEQFEEALTAVEEGLRGVDKDAEGYSELLETKKQLLTRVESSCIRKEGNELYKKGELEAALLRYSDALSLDRDDIRNYLNRAAALFEMGEHEKCLSDCLEAIAIGKAALAQPHIGSMASTVRKRMVRAKLRAGNAYIALGRYDSALNSFETAKSLEPSDEVEKKIKEAKHLLKSRIDPNWEIEEIMQNRKKAEEEKERGNEMYKARKFDKAILYYDSASSLDETAVAPVLNRAAAYMELESFTEATKDCDTALFRASKQLQELEAKTGSTKSAEHDKLMKMIAKIYNRKAAIAQRSGNTNLAIKMYGESLEWARDDEKTKEQLDRLTKSRDRKTRLDQAKEDTANGDVSMKYDQFEAAIDYYNKAEKADPSHSLSDSYLLFGNRATAYLRLEKPDAALYDAKKAVELNPKFKEGYLLQAQALNDLEPPRMVESLRALNKAAEIDPSHELTLDRLRDTVTYLLAEYQKKSSTVPQDASQASFAKALARMKQDKALQSVLKKPAMVDFIQKFSSMDGWGRFVLRKLKEDKEFVVDFCKLFTAGIVIPLEEDL